LDDSLAGLFENCSKNFDLDYSMVPNIDEHIEKLPLQGGFFHLSTTKSYMIELWVTRLSR
jgi:hypothetical protein